MKTIQTFCPWITPKVFTDFDDPAPAVQSFFDHFGPWIEGAQQTVLNFCTGNGDHILNYRGRAGMDDSFDWARYNCHGHSDADRKAHNANWLRRVREGGERSYNPYMAGPSFILSEQVMNYRKLAGIYEAFRREADRRSVNFKLLEYLEPGPEFCRCEWKTIRHPEGASGSADAGGNIVQGVIDVCSHLNADDHAYAAYPQGIPAGTNTGDFVAAQTDAFTRDFGLDGVFLGNQFGLIGFWHPDNAPPATPERRQGILRFFQRLRETMDQRLVYWMDTYWPADVEIERWSMSEEAYVCLDAVMVSNFSVIVERTQGQPNIESRLRIAARHNGRPDTLFTVDFVDPWYWYRVYLDERKNYLWQHDLYRRLGPRCNGVSFFANDTFGQWVMPDPLGLTWDVVREAHLKDQTKAPRYIDPLPNSGPT